MILVSEGFENHIVFVMLCLSPDCGPLSPEWPLEINTTSVEFGTVVQYSCADGYQLNGARHALCSMKGLWEPDLLPTCQCKCTLLLSSWAETLTFIILHQLLLMTDLYTGMIGSPALWAGCGCKQKHYKQHWPKA